MKSTIQKIISQFSLLPHPEGGYYAETYRSPETLIHTNRSLATSIYFLLTSENISRFHRIKSDELWYFHQGSALTVHTLDENGHTEYRIGNDIDNNERPYLLVKANTIFGSSLDTDNSFALVSCVVAPGFDFSDFELFTKNELMKDYADFEKVIERLT